MVSGFTQQNGQIPYAGIKDVTATVGSAVQNVDVKGVAQNAAVGIKDAAVNDSFVGAANGLVDTSPKGIATTLGIWGGLAGFVQWFSKKAFEGKWEDSLLGKMQKAGDDITNAVKGTKIGGNVNNAISPRLSKAKAFILDKVPFLNTPLRPVNGMAKSQGNGIKSYVSSDAASILKTYVEKAEHNFKHLGFADKEAALKFLTDISESPHDSGLIKQLIDKLRVNGGKRYSADKLFKIPWTNIHIPNIPFLKRNMSFDQIANKLQAVNGTPGGSALGKGLVKNFATIFESATNGFAGSKIMIGIQAMIFASAVKKTVEAPKGEKLSTFMDAVFSDLMYLVTLPLTIKLPNALGGAKFLGMGKNATEQIKNVEKYSSAIKTLNKSVEEGTINFAQYMRDKKAIKTMLWGEKLPKDAKLTQKLARLIQKPFKAAGNFFSSGLEPIMSYKLPMTGKFGDFGRRIANSVAKGVDQLKGSGGLMRMALAMFVISPLLVRGMTKISHLIFGRPTKSSLDDYDKAKAEKKAQKEEAKKAKAEAKKARLEQSQNPAATAQEPKVQSPSAPVMSPFMQEYLKNRPQGNGVQQPVQPQQPAQAPVQTPPPKAMSPMAQNDLNAVSKQPKPSQNPKETNPQEPKEPVRTYIPSSAPAKNNIEKKGVKDFDQGLQTVISRSEAAEANALKYLQ